MAIRVAVNQLTALGLKTGIGYYASQLLRCLREQAGADQVDGFPRGSVRHFCAASARLRSLLERGGGQAEQGGAGSGGSWKAALVGGLRRRLRRGYDFVLNGHLRRLLTPQHYDLYHEPNILAVPCELPSVATLHDLSVLVHPEWHPVERVAQYEQRFAATLRHSVHFLTGSDYIRREIVQTLQVAPERITRVYHGVRPNLKPLPAAEVAQTLQELGLPPRYLLVLGTIEPRKNVLRVMQAYCRLPAALRSHWPLLLVGKWGWRTEAVADFYHREGKHRGVIHCGYVADEHLPAIYNGARALVFPTFYEGFGLPALEMMACGGAVLASTAGSVAETVGGHAHLVDPEDTDGWRTALARVLTEHDWWYELRQGVREHAAAFTWDRAAIETWRVYRTLAGAAQPLRRAG